VIQDESDELQRPITRFYGVDGDDEMIRSGASPCPIEDEVIRSGVSPCPIEDECDGLQRSIIKYYGPDDDENGCLGLESSQSEDSSDSEGPKWKKAKNKKLHTIQSDDDENEELNFLTNGILIDCEGFGAKGDRCERSTTYVCQAAILIYENLTPVLSKVWRIRVPQLDRKSQEYKDVEGSLRYATKIHGMTWANCEMVGIPYEDCRNQIIELIQPYINQGFQICAKGMLLELCFLNKLGIQGPRYAKQGLVKNQRGNEFILVELEKFGVPKYPGKYHHPQAELKFFLTELAKKRSQS